MGRLYDKRDLAFNTDFWNRQEQLLHADIANGTQPASILNELVVEERPCPPSCGCGRVHHRSHVMRDRYNLMRKRERMKLLRTQQLLSDLGVAKSNFDRCPHCHVESYRGKDRIVECSLHEPAYKKAKSNIYWAGERNLAERNARGQIRDDDALDTKDALEGKEIPVQSGDQPLNPLNKWEQWYLSEKASGQWKIEDARLYDTTPDYNGFLEMLLENEEMNAAEYSIELERLARQRREQEESAIPWAGNEILPGMQRGRERFRRDTRYNLAS